MVDIVAFLKFLRRYKWLVIIVPSLCVAITFFLVKNLPNKYGSQAQIATGISDRAQEILSSSHMDYFRVSQQFGNLMEMMQSRRVLNLLSLQLVLHDLENPASSFRPLPEEMEELTAAQHQEIISMYRQKLIDGTNISPLDNKGHRLFDYIVMMGYDEKTILSNLEISRNGESDYINVYFLSEDPELSAYVVNTLSREFIHYYNTVNSVSQQSTMTLIDSLLKEKENTMNQKNAELQNYKANSGVVNLNAQAEVLFQQISEYENKRSQSLSDIQSLRGAIKQINDKLNNVDDVDLNSNVSSKNNELLRIGKELESANKRYIDNNLNAEDKQRVDSLTRLRSSIIAGSSARQPNNPQALRQNLIQERTTLEISLSRIENGISSIDNDLANLRSKYYTMAPTDASVQNLEREADLAVKEYTEAMNRHNQASIENAAGLRLRIIQPGLPSLPEPSKKALYLAAGGFASLSICLAALLIVFLLDNKITSSKQLASLTGQKVIGSLSFINGKDKDLRNIWGNANATNANYDIYKDLIRALRFEISRSIPKSGSKVLGITSLNSGEGKTFVSSSLAYAYALIGKKVLLIGDDCTDLSSLLSNRDENKEDNDLGGNVRASQFEKFLIKKEIQAEDLITVLNRNPNSSSILELRDADNLIAGFDILRDTFDIIIIDINSLRDMNRAKEWLMFTDKSIAVFKWGNAIREEDKEFLDYVYQQEGFMGWVFNQVNVSLAAK